VVQPAHPGLFAKHIRDEILLLFTLSVTIEPERTDFWFADLLVFLVSPQEKTWSLEFYLMIKATILRHK
jgi:hypothetical protein